MLWKSVHQPSHYSGDWRIPDNRSIPKAEAGLCYAWQHLTLQPPILYIFNNGSYTLIVVDLGISMLCPTGRQSESYHCKLGIPCAFQKRSQPTCCIRSSRLLCESDNVSTLGPLFITDRTKTLEVNTSVRGYVLWF